MTAHRTPVAALTASGAWLLFAALLLVAACGTADPARPPAPAAPPTLEVPIPGAGGGDIPDCDVADRRERDTDCGWQDGATWREYTWVRAGRTVPPPGWTAVSERTPGVRVTPARTTAAPRPPVSGDDSRGPAPKPIKTAPTKRSKR